MISVNTDFSRDCFCFSMDKDNFQTGVDGVWLLQGDQPKNSEFSYIIRNSGIHAEYTEFFLI